jgi:hypothetical protein
MHLLILFFKTEIVLRERMKVAHINLKTLKKGGKQKF